VSRREIILQELGLWPVWVPRKRAGAAAAAALDTAPGTPPETLLEGAPGPRAERIARMDWPALKEAVRTCTACPLHRKRKQAVFGVGDERADWLFVGEGPGAEEDARGEPFVGQAGRLLDNMLAAIGLQRGRDVYVANVLKCRPPGNRVPEPGEAAACEPFLLRQIALIRPRLIVALGRTAADNLLRNDASIASLRGRLHDFRGTPLLVTYHPAYLLRNLADKSKAWEDLCLARDTMQRLKTPAPDPT
jgi:DNA polymerase